VKVVYVTPVGKPRMTQRDKWAQRPAVLRYREYCDRLREAMPDYVLPSTLGLIFYIPMPRSWSARKRTATLGAPHDQKPDIDNLAKGFMDAFKTEDKHVSLLHVEKVWSVEGHVDIFDAVHDERLAA
jgi:Holliday junction resolvase RusA-like endonuclease